MRRLAPLRSLSFVLLGGLALPLLAGACASSPTPAARPATAPPAVVPEAPPPAPPAAELSSLLPNARQPLPGVLTGGVPSDQHLAALAAAGYRTLVDLRTAEEKQPGASERARALGLHTVELPIGGAQDLDGARVKALGEVLADRTRYPLVIHCASGNRVGALLALEQAQIEGKPAEEALAVGKAAGLTRLEPAVRELLGLPPP
jgi:protein tyrosine phosphatase (PTP) superfamily phosphohydrolase (DUF442 family)